MRSSPSPAALFLGLAALAFVGALFAAWVAGPSDALPTVPACAVSLDNAQQTAKITAVQGEIMKFSGNISVTTGTSNPRTLAIEASIDPSEWAAQVNPTTENVSDGEVVRFNATVAVPPAALASVRATLTIGASFQAIPGVQGSLVQCGADATILVEQYYRVDIDTTHPRISINSGPVGTEATVIVHNLGNGRDSFTLRLEEPEYLLASKISTSLPRSVTLEADQETTMEFTVNATSDAKAGNYDVAVVLSSDVQPQTARDSFVFTLTINETIIGQLLPGDFTSAAILGGVVAALVAVVAVRKRARRKRAARDLQALLRQRRAAEQEAAVADGWAADGWGDDGAADAGAADAGAADAGAGGVGAAQGPPADPRPAGEPAQRVRVKVKAPPKA